jgi:hypothetical protein
VVAGNDADRVAHGELMRALMILGRLKNWIRFRHFGPVARSRKIGYILRCSDEEVISSLLVEASHFERI